MSTKTLQILGSIVKTDETLTVSKMAADAKIVGDKLAGVEADLDVLSAFVGDTAISEQISAAVADCETKEAAQTKYDELENTKQDALVGTEGQIVCFDAEGKAIASDLEYITVEEIDAICGGAIEYAEDVMF